MQNFKMKTLTNSIDNKEQFSVHNTNFEGFDILTFKHLSSNELFFIGSQCAEMLEYNDTAQAIRTNISDEDKCKLEYDRCMELLKLISNNINGLDDSSRNSLKPVPYTGLTQNGANSLISNEINPNEINELGKPENLNQIREDDSNSLNSKRIYNFGPRGATFISEEGLYDLIFDSKKPEAKAFRKTVHKILKEIRQTGGYNLDKVPAINTTQLDNISKYMETNSNAMTVMTQLLDSNLTMDNRIQNITNPMIHAKIGSYTEALFLNPHSAVVANKVSTPTKNWSNNTTCWTAIVNLGVYAHTQRVKNADDRKALYNRMDNFETDTNLLVKTSQVAIAAKFNKIVTDFKTMHNKDIADLKSEHNAAINNLNSEIEKLDSANKQLSTEFKTVVEPNFESLSVKIETLEEAISILKSN